MNADRAFLDTNLFVYLYSETDSVKRERVLAAINTFDRVVSTQVLNEFCGVALRKLRHPVQAVKNALGEICETCRLAAIDETIIMKALDVHERYGYSYYDSLIIASALEQKCRYLLSEDMNDGQVIEGYLTIKNIFSGKD
ncbi:MAG: PIN domain-containing protein [Synergistaceae bacterium]|jgi:predicted nucleic acid-binding protein|nr:PIN domain-containing protein [Synergistaceae bacterium]